MPDKTNDKLFRLKFSCTKLLTMSFHFTWPRRRLMHELVGTSSYEVSFFGFTLKPYTRSLETAQKMPPSISLPIYLKSVNL
jgi:hypothetical protein